MEYKSYNVVGSPKSLAHYGILGMKWGVRNYQNKDGTLTAAGRRRYKNGKEKDDIPTDGQTVNKVSDKIANFKQLDLITETVDENSERGIEAAETGIRALQRIYPGEYDDMDPKDRWSRIWFLSEDQTIGFGTVSDLANQGKTAAEIKDIMSAAEEISRSGEHYTRGVFQLTEGWIPEKYIEACVTESEYREERAFNRKLQETLDPLMDLKMSYLYDVVNKSGVGSYEAAIDNYAAQELVKDLQWSENWELKNKRNL